MDPDELIADLDPDQRAAVIAESHLVAVVAGAGSGKTRVLTRRVAYRVATGAADARHTLVLTFTREAAGELRRRLRQLGVREHVDAGTFHSIMLAVLRQRWADSERPPQTVVPDRWRLLRDALADSAHRSHGDMESARNEIDWAMAQGISPDDYPQQARRESRRPTGGVERAADAYERYEMLKRRRGVIDFDDVLLHVLSDAQRDTDFADGLRWRFRHLLVDEAQDLNPVQHRLIDVLRRGRDDLFLVGDPAQAIYGFNGSDPRMLTEVESRFPGIEVIRLPVNHRCTPQIVGAGTHVLRIGDAPVDLRSARHDGPVPRLVDCDDEHGEAEFVALHIARGDPNLVHSGNVAVLARTNAQLNAFETALANVGLPVRRRADGPGSPLQLAIRHASSLTSASALRGWAHDMLDDVSSLTVAQAELEAIRADRATSEDASPPRHGSTRSSRPRQRSGVEELADARLRVEKIDAERRVAAALLEFLRDQPRADGADFRGWVATTNPFDSASSDGIELLTFHASKGREWHTVVVTGVETSLVPHKSATTNDARAEEARLLYVAMTRATDVLMITAARRRHGYARKVSPFVSELELTEPEPQPPPRELLRRTRPTSPIDSLRAWRADAARRADVLPPQLVSDHDLSAIAEHRPMTAEELADVTSMGAITARRLAPDILPVLDH